MKFLMNNKDISIKKLLNLLGVNNSYLIFLVLIFLLSSLVDIVSLSLIAPFIVSVLNPSKLIEYKFLFFFKNYEGDQLVLLLGILLLIIFLLKTIFSISIRWYIKKLSLNLERKIQNKLMFSYQQLNYELFISRNISEYIRNIKDLSQNCASSIDNYLKVISEIIIFSVIIIFLLTISFYSVIFIFSVFLLFFLIYQIFLKPINLSLGKKNIFALKQLYKFIDAGLKGFKEIKVISKESFILQNLKKFNYIIYDTNLKSSLISDTPRHLLELIVLFCIVFLISYMSLQSSDFIKYLPTIGIFLFSILRILPSLAVIISGTINVHNNKFAISSVYKDLNFVYKIEKDYNLDNKNNTFKSLELINCNFNYNNSSQIIFEKLNFLLQKNDCIGVVGPSGSGKTTLVELILGLVKPKEGLVKFNSEFTESLNKKIKNIAAYVTQDPIVIDDTIKANIVLEQDESLIDKNRLEDSIKKADINDFLKNFTNGLDTKIGENGVRLSGGQYRRLALARAFYHGGQILILDEATSSLDRKSEDLILEQIKKLKGTMTIVVISHQDNALKYCDKIYKILNKKLIVA